MHHSHSLCALLGERFGSDQALTGAEVGVWKGRTSSRLLQAFPHLVLYLVDAWAAENYAGRNAFDPLARIKPNQWRAIRRQAEAAIAFAGDRARWLVGDCIEQARRVPPDSLDFVFLDPAHSEVDTDAAIDAWSPKVRSGGLVIGHDYGYPARGYEGVKRAVDRYAVRHRRLLAVEQASHLWYWPQP